MREACYEKYLMKRCAKCKRQKSSGEFYRESGRSDGLRPYCKHCCRTDNKRGYASHRDTRLQQQRDYVEKNRAKVNQKNTEWRKSVRLETLRHYSEGDPLCQICGERNITFLTIDHIEGGGSEHRRKITRGGYATYIWLRQHKFPEGFRVLCFNCNYGEYRGDSRSSRGGILSGPEIARLASLGKIRVTPFNPAHLNPASLDLTLGTEVTQYEVDGIFDVRQAPHVKKKQIGPEGFVLQAHQPYLMHTEETVWSDCTVLVVDGKSSLGRQFISVHQTAGYIDPGFEGQVTLEVTSYHSIRVYAGMRFCQIRFHPIVGQVELYDGHYQGNTARGAVPSQVHLQMREND